MVTSSSVLGRAALRAHLSGERRLIFRPSGSGRRVTLDHEEGGEGRAWGEEERREMVITWSSSG